MKISPYTNLFQACPDIARTVASKMQTTHILTLCEQYSDFKNPCDAELGLALGLKRVAAELGTVQRVAAILESTPKKYSNLVMSPSNPLREILPSDLIYRGPLVKKLALTNSNPDWRSQVKAKIHGALHAPDLIGTISQAFHAYPKVLATDLSALIRAQMKLSEVRVIYKPSEFFFPRRKEMKASYLTSPMIATIRSMADALTESTFATRELKRHNLWNYVFNQLVEVAAYCQWCLPKCEKYLKQLNITSVWMNTTDGTLMRGLLAAAARKAGIEVVCHSHGQGWGQLDFSKAYFHPSRGATKLVAFNSTQAKLLEENRPIDLLTKKRPVVTVSEAFDSSERIRDMECQRVSNKRCASLMYVTRLYHGEHQRMYEMLPGFLIEDFHFRMFAKLKAIVPVIYHKPHPSSIPIESESLKKLECVWRVTEKYETMKIDPDIYIIDDAFSTIFPKILKKQKPVIFLEWPDDRLNRESKKILKSRCYWFPITAEGSGHLSADFSGIEGCVKRQKHCFYGISDTLYAAL